MKQVTTYVGIDAHKKDLFIAMLIGTAPTPVTWQVANEPGRCGGWCASSSATRRDRARLLRSRTVRVRVAAPGDDGAGALRRHRARLDSAEAG